MITSLAWHLVTRPVGVPDGSSFQLREVDLPGPRDGELLVENTWMSVDPYMRGRMGADKGYAPYELDQPLDGRAIGRVLEARAPGFEPGQAVMHNLGWRDKAIVPAAEVMSLRPGVPEQAYLGVLGNPGLTAYFGLLDVAAMRSGDVVFVSGAAGAVGSLVVQLAKVKGASRVIGSAGGPEKTAWLREIGCDAVIDYRQAPDLEAALAKAAPDGIDVYFDNVGGDHLFAAIACASQYARFAECGMVGEYNTGYNAKPRNLMQIVVKRLQIRGFGGADYFDRMGEFLRETTPLVRSGEIRSRETVVQGLGEAPAAFIGLFSGQNIGKMLVKLG